jgi:hypothetical protein
MFPRARTGIRNAFLHSGRVVLARFRKFRPPTKATISGQAAGTIGIPFKPVSPIYFADSRSIALWRRSVENILGISRCPIWLDPIQLDGRILG